MISMHHAMIFPTVDVEWSGEMDILLRKITQDQWHAVCIGHHVLFPTTLAGRFYKRVGALSERGHQLSTRELPTSATIQLNLLPTPVPEIDCLCGVDGRWAISVTPAYSCRNLCRRFAKAWSWPAWLQRACCSCCKDTSDLPPLPHVHFIWRGHDDSGRWHHAMISRVDEAIITWQKENKRSTATLDTVVS